MRKLPHTLIVFIFLSVNLFPNTIVAELTVPGNYVDFDGWRYIPIVEEEMVHSIVMVSIDEMLVGDNINTMWFIQDENSWNGFAWNGQVLKESLSNIKQALLLDDESDLNWPVENIHQPDGEGYFSPKLPIAVGLFTDDPLLLVVEAFADPTVFLEVLVNAGWKASDANIFKSELIRDQLLSGLEAGFLLELSNEGTGFQTIVDSVDDSAGGSATCKYKITYGNPGAFLCTQMGAWVLTSQSTVVTGGGCLIRNCWQVNILKWRARTVTVRNTSCAVCTMTQNQSKLCSATACETDLTFWFTNCAGGIPASYVLPVGPSARPCTPTTTATVSCPSWSSWFPDINTVCP